MKKNMKKIISTLVYTLLCISFLSAQSVPNGINFQAVARDADGEIISDKTINLRLSLKTQLPVEETFYVETHRVTTNSIGMFSLVIGKGRTTQGVFEEVPWSSAEIMMETAMDTKGGSDFKILSTSNLLAVPYAFHANTASKLVEDDGIEDDLAKLNTDNSCATNKCDCDEGYTDLELYYFGEDDVLIEAFNSYSYNPANLMVTWANSMSGDFLTINENNSVLTNGVLPTRVYFRITKPSGEICYARIYTQCPVPSLPGQQEGQEILGKTFGNFTVFSHTDKGNGIKCTLENIRREWHMGGNVVALSADTTNRAFGTKNYEDLAFITNDTVRMVITKDGDLLIGSERVVLEGNLEVQGDSVIVNKNLYVLDTTFTRVGFVEETLGVGGDVTIEGATTINNSLAANGQVTINANVSGGDTNYGAYPLRVEGSDQGIAVKLTAGTPNNSNNFITFFNSSGGAVGRIEGETAGEATTTPEYIFDNSILVAEEIEAGINVGTSFTPIVVGGVIASSGPCGPCIAHAAVNLALATANLTAYNVFALENLGVTYQSGSADYAEWLERNNPYEQISAGDIVGVNGGKISKLTFNSQQYMVISTKPAILGNMPMDGNEELYEKVAFMGQIPVKVRGVVLSGDYILPSGLNDGTGIAVSRSKIKPEQYREIVGVAWSETYIDNGVSLVNMAIGLNANDVADLAIQQEKRINDLENKFNSLEQRFLALENGTDYTPSVGVAEASSVTELEAEKVMTRYEMIASSMPAELSDEVMEDAILSLKNQYEIQGIKFEDHPGLNKLFIDTAYQAEVIKKAQETYKISYQSILKAAESRN